MRRGSSLYLTLHPLAGSDLDTCIREAVQVSVKAGIGVDFDFNGVHVLTGPDTDEAALSKEVMAAMSKPKPRVAAAWRQQEIPMQFSATDREGQQS